MRKFVAYGLAVGGLTLLSTCAKPTGIQIKEMNFSQRCVGTSSEATLAVGLSGARYTYINPDGTFSYLVFSRVFTDVDNPKRIPYTRFQNVEGGKPVEITFPVPQPGRYVIEINAITPTTENPFNYDNLSKRWDRKTLAAKKDLSPLDCKE